MRPPEHKVLIDKKHGEHWAMTNWCEENFGSRWSAVDNHSGAWCCFWAGLADPKAYNWYFSNQKDLVMFMLRWS